MFGKALTAAMFMAATTLVAEELQVSTDVAPKCPVSGAGINKEVSASFNGGDVYFCCPKCKAAFDGESKEQVSKANHQLVVTKQAKQKGCPFSGGAVNANAGMQLSGVEVKFCCTSCRSRVAKSDQDDQLGLVFSTAAFKKGFEIAKADDAGATE